MSCDDFEQRLNEVLDDRLDPAADQQLVQHARLCPECSAVLAAQSRCFRALNGPWGLSSSRRFHSLATGEPELSGLGGGDVSPEVEMPGKPARDGQGKRGERWKRWSAMISPLAVSAALAVLMWSAGQREKSGLPSMETRDANVTVRRAWPGAGALVWSGPRSRTSDAEIARIEMKPVELAQTEIASVSLAMPVASGLSAGAQGIQRVAGETDLLLRSRMCRWRESLVTLPATPLESVSILTEGIQPVADSIGCLVEAVRESVTIGPLDQSESSLDTTWVIDGKWVA